MGVQKVPSSQEALVRNVLDRLVDLGVQVFRIVGASKATIVNRNGTHIRHAELRHHGTSHAFHLLQITTCTRGHLGITEDQLLRHSAAQGTSNAGLEHSSRDQALIFARCEPCESLRLTTRDHCDLVH
eukprot:Skav226299  [mRNA]  locus=scaffold3301:326903:327993:- [translate_table: standard]